MDAAHRRPSSSATTRRLSAVGTAALLGLGVLVGTTPATSAATEFQAYRDFNYGSAAGSRSPSADKPQSKLWYNDGAWWALMLSPVTKTVRIFELRSDHTWRDAGVTVDNRAASTGDALWTGSYLYVGSRVASGNVRLDRFSYTTSTRRYTKDSGFPVTIAKGGTESVTIAREPGGRLWAAYTQHSTVWVTHSTTSDTAWTPPFHPNVPDVTVSSDDIATCIAIDNAVGVMWSDQQSGAFRFAVHPDGAADGLWSVETPESGPLIADDHINVKNVVASDAGTVYAAVKTSLNDETTLTPGDPLVQVLKRTPDGAWSAHTVGTVSQDFTRPIAAIDQSAGLLYVFYTLGTGGTNGTIHYKTAGLSDLTFPTGNGSTAIAWSGADINNVTGSKDPVTSTTGLVVLASDEKAHVYYHAERAPTG